MFKLKIIHVIVGIVGCVALVGFTMIAAFVIGTVQGLLETDFPFNVLGVGIFLALIWWAFSKINRYVDNHWS